MAQSNVDWIMFPKTCKQRNRYSIYRVMINIRRMILIVR